MKDENNKEKKLLRRSIVLSLLIHMLFMLKIVDEKREQSNVSTQEKAKKVVKIALIPKEKVQKKSPKKLQKKELQIVNNELKAKEEKPLDTRFLGEKNQKFDRQTIAKNVDIFNRAGKGSKTGDQLSKSQKSKSKQVASSKKKKNVFSPQKKTRLKKELSLADLGLGDAIKANKDTKDLGKLKALGIKGGDPSSQGLAKNNDFIEDVPLGDLTNLNTVEFKYYGFYHRIRQKLEQYWGANLREKSVQLYKKGRRLASDENHITSLEIKLDSGGSIIDVIVKSSSGVQELDKAAIDSFNQAGPFPNPPKGMLKNGFAVISWGFVVKS